MFVKKSEESRPIKFALHCQMKKDTVSIVIKSAFTRTIAATLLQYLDIDFHLQ